mmetsp:Transcript_64667/g.140835  ORF Transcript_64667/g.140835 Transcript_64667/m.140835 type:complete len:927 (+) Transcript_64667:34-2814(+)
MDRLDKNTVHEICTNQVVVTLQACVKELVENSLDAGATRIEVRLRESGSELLEIVDNGRGISPEDYGSVARRHATSKIREYDDLSQSLSTFGFRGEALSAIAAMGEMTVCTRTSKDAAAALLAYDRFGALTKQETAAREVGTTITVKELFKRLPVRHREFLRNAKAQMGAMMKMMQAYAVGTPEIRFHVVAEKVRGHGAGRATLLSTSGAAKGWRQAAAAVLGDSVVADVEPFELLSQQTGWSISGLISTPLGGRRARDTQMYYVNHRPIDPPKRISKLINDTYHQYNSRDWPVVILSFTAAQGLVDVNVTPDKRTVFLHNEELLLADVQQRLTELYAPAARGPGASLTDFGICSKPIGGVITDIGEGDSSGSSIVAPLTSQPDMEVRTPEPPNHRGHFANAGEVAVAYPETPEKPAAGASQSDARATEELVTLRISDFDQASAPSQEDWVMEHVAAPTTTQDDFHLSVLEATPSQAPRLAEVQHLDLTVLQPQLGREESLPGVHHLDLSVLEPQPGEQALSPTQDLIPAGQGEPLGGPLGGQEQGQEQGLSGPSAGEGQIVPAEAPVDDATMEDVVVGDVASLPPVTVAVSMASLEAAAARRRSRNTKQKASEQRGAPSVHFPSAFSLASLRDDRRRSSLEEVAKFGTGAVPGAGPSGNTEGRLDGQAFRFDRDCFTKMRVIGQFNLGFIIAALDVEGSSEGGSGLQLFIVDQHASDEKFRFEALNRESRVDRQPLVNAHSLQLTPAQEQLAEGSFDIFERNGFGIERDEARPPGKRLRLTALPTCQGLVFGERDVHDLLFALEEAETQSSSTSTQAAAGSRPRAEAGLLDLAGHRGSWSATAVPRPRKVWALLACRACRGAVMIGKALRVAEMEKILRNLSTLEQPWNCPHGRPTMRHLVDTSAAWRRPPQRPPLTSLLERVMR